MKHQVSIPKGCAVQPTCKIWGGKLESYPSYFFRVIYWAVITIVVALVACRSIAGKLSLLPHAEGGGFDPKDSTQSFLLMVIVLSLKLVIKTPPALITQKHVHCCHPIDFAL